MATFGKVQEFNPDSDSVTAYIERVNLFFTANEIPSPKRVAVFLSVIGGKTYERLRNIVSPKLPDSLKYSELVEVFKEHYEPKPLVIAQRFHFHRRNQTASESVSEYMAELHRLSTNCDFRDYLDQALRDRLVCGLRNEGIQRRLLAEADLTLKRALDLALGMEAAETNAKSLKGTEQVVHKFAASRPSTTTPCYRCGRPNHEPSACRFRDSTCHFCKKKGHIAPACRAKKSLNRPQRGSGPRKYRPQQTQYVSASDEQTSTVPSEQEELSLFAIGEQSSRPLYAELLVSGKQLRMEIDTGAAVSIISEKQQRALLPDVPVQTSNIKLKTYTGEQMPVLGQMQVPVQYGEQTAELVLIVVAGDGPSLLGRSWLQSLRLDWKTIGAVVAEKPSDFTQLLAKHAEIFEDELGTVQPFTAKLHVRPDAVPKFCKARPVPFSIKKAIEEELGKLEEAGILEKITYSEWAAPIVAVPKKDGKIRICGDYRESSSGSRSISSTKTGRPICNLGGREKVLHTRPLASLSAVAVRRWIGRVRYNVNQHPSRSVPLHKAAVWHCFRTSNVPESDGHNTARHTQRNLLHRRYSRYRKQRRDASTKPRNSVRTTTETWNTNEKREMQVYVPIRRISRTSH